MQALMVRFGPSGYEDVLGELAKIWQTMTILKYQGRFEWLSSQARDWLEPQLVGTFVAGLHQDIKWEGKMYRPRTMSVTISFARLQEEKI